MASARAASFSAALGSLLVVGATTCLAGAIAEDARARGALVPQEPEGALTLGDAVSLALIGNPDLAVFDWELRAVEARQLQARLRPNPELELEVENAGGTLPGFSRTENTLSVGYLIELGGKRSARLEAARGESSVVALDFAAARLVVISDVQRRFVESVALERLVVLSDEVVRTAEETLAAVQAKVRAGAVSPAEESRSSVDLANARVERESILAERSTARVRLSMLWGTTRPRFGSVAGRLDSLDALPALDALLARVGESPDVRRWEAERQAGERRLALERSQRVPDLELRAGYRVLAESDDHTFVGAVSLPIPLLNRNQGGIAGATAATGQGAAHVVRARVARETEVAEAHGAASRARLKIESLRGAVVPGALRALQEIRDGYQRGRFSYLDLLEAQRTWTQARREEVTNLVEFHQATADLERLVGGPLNRPAAAEEGTER